MKSRGVQHDPLSDIANIRNTLKGYTAGFTIIKELVQNAEDAGASYIHIGWHSGFPSEKTDHPLLQGPALCMVNDGPFEKKHEEAICRMGLGSKGADEQSIGRFGLGLKSVFHLCEAFFFMASDLVSGESVRLTELFNPWHGRHHSEWEMDHANDQVIINRALESFLPKRPWFALWLPLRRKEMCDGVAPIIPHYPGHIRVPDEAIREFFRSEFAEGLNDVLPGLRNLNDISFSVWENEQWFTKYNIKASPDCKRRLYPEKVLTPWALSGSIHTSSNPSSSNYVTQFFGREDWVSASVFDALKEDDSWPKVVAIEEDGFDPGRKEKALPHYSNYFTCRPKKNRTGKLRIKWAVFLPVGNEAYDEIELPNVDYDITLILHGYFFLNSERTNIDGLEHNFGKSNGIYTEWNKNLAFLGNLPNILVAFEEFVSSENFSDSEIQDITTAFVDYSKLFDTYRANICSEHQWLYKLSGHSPRWCCVPAADEVFLLPSPSSIGFDHLFKLFPQLRDLSEQYNICFSENHLVSNKDCKHLTDSMLMQLFSSMEKSIFHDYAAGEYLWRVIAMHSPMSQSLWDFLGNTPLFRTRTIKDGIEKISSIKSLLEKHGKGELFSGSGNTKLERLIQSVCPDLNLTIFTKEEAFQHAYPSQLLEIPDLNSRSFAKTVLLSKKLGALSARIASTDYFIRNVSQYSLDGIYRNAVRYLLHGDPSKIPDPLTLYLPANDNSASQTWNKIVESVLGGQGELWRVIDGDFNQYLTQQFLTQYGIEKINVQSTSSLLENTDVAHFDTSKLDENDRRNVLLYFQDEELIKRLPIHEKIGGGFVAISELSYLENNFQLQKDVKQYWVELLSRACVIKRFSDSVGQARQRDLLPELDWNAAIELALKSPDPAKYATVVMAGLKSIGTPRQEIGILVKESKWLPLKNGQTTTPQNVIHIDEAKEEIHRILNEQNDGLCGILALDDWILTHAGLKALKQQFLNTKESLEYLGLWISDKDMGVGLKKIGSPEEFQEFVEVFSPCPSNVMPLQTLLSNLASNDDLMQLSFELFLPSIQDKITADHLGKILNFLCSKHKDSALEGRRKVIKWYNRYLQQALLDGSFKTVITDIELLNQLGHWTSSSKLTLPSQGIAKRHQLSVEQAQILEEYFRPEEPQGTDKNKNPVREIDTEELLSLKDSSDLLTRYFETIENTGVPREMIGAVGALLGNYQPLKDWAQRMLGDQSLATIRGEMVPARLRNTALNSIRFVVKVIEGDTSLAISLTGEPFSVSISENPESLLFGNDQDMWWSVPNHPETQGLNCHLIKLLSAENFRGFPQDEVASLLRKTAELIIFNVYCNRIQTLSPNIGCLWENLSETGQRNIVTAQLYLLNAGDFYIKQLGGDHHNLVRQNLRKWEEARRYKVDSELYPNQKEELLRKADKTERESREELRELLIHDDGVHDVFVNAFREKMRSYQYDISSIPFEFFQNADDAYQELENMGCAPGNDIDQKPFIICIDETGVRFAHWGRCINEHYRYGPFDRGKDLGFDRDLQKMLTLSASDKGLDKLLDDLSNRQEVTGKFGLGFKSVFFASPSPKVLSGRLSFCVRGGFYPLQLDRTEETELREKLNTLRPGNQYRGTIFDLRLYSEEGKKTEQVLSRFLPLAGLQVAFSKQIKKCEIWSSVHDEKIYSWQEQQVVNSQDFFVGKFFSENHRQSKTALILRPSKGHKKLKECSVLFHIDVRGFAKLADDIPSVWITAPTQEHLSVGFAVNGPFEPDVGRSLLARNSELNRSLFSDLAVAVGEALERFYENSQEDWPDFSSSLRLGQDATPVLFWETLWNLMSDIKLIAAKSDAKGSSANLLYKMIWDSPGVGYRKFIDSCPVIPSCLWGKYNTLVSLPDIKHSIDGMLDQKNIFEAICHWSSFLEKVNPGGAISGSKINSVLTRTLGEHFGPLRRVTFRDAILWELDKNDAVAPQSARRIGKIIDKKFEKSAISSEYSPEYAALSESFKNFKFKSNSERFALGRELIVGRTIPDYIDKDETFRAAFAPDSAVLSTAYDTDAIKFFVMCRGNMVAPAEKLASWVREAESEEKRNAALIYISQGELGDKVAGHLREDGMSNTWLAGLNYDSPYFVGLDDNDIDELLRRKLSSIESLQNIPFYWDNSFTFTKYADPKSSLQNIYEWWNSNKSDYLKRYETSIYPNGQIPNLKDDEVGSIDRSEWLTMLILGAFHTLGRTKPEQHRSFISLCRNNGWWDIFSAGEPTKRPDEWMRVLDEYINKQVESSPFEQWMNRFPTIYRLARKLDDYAEAFFSIDQQGAEVNVEKTLMPRAFEVFQGGGIDAAPIARTLGMGACFALREMMRSGLLNNGHAFPYCYVPTESVRSLMAGMQCKGLDNGESYFTLSKTIHEFLCQKMGKKQARFQNSFDIPLQFVAKDRELQDQLLKYPKKG